MLALKTSEPLCTGLGRLCQEQRESGFQCAVLLRNHPRSLLPIWGSGTVPVLTRLSVAQGCKGWNCCQIPSWRVAWLRAPAPLATGGKAGCCHFSFFGPRPEKEKSSSMLHAEPQALQPGSAPRAAQRALTLTDLPIGERSALAQQEPLLPLQLQPFLFHQVSKLQQGIGLELPSAVF